MKAQRGQASSPRLHSQETPDFSNTPITSLEHFSIRKIRFLTSILIFPEHATRRFQGPWVSRKLGACPASCLFVYVIACQTQS